MYIPAFLSEWSDSGLDKIKTLCSQGAKCVAVALDHPSLGTVAISDGGAIRQGDLREELRETPKGEFKVGDKLMGRYGLSIYNCTIIAKDDKHTALEWQLERTKMRTIDVNKDLAYYRLMRFPPELEKVPWWKREYHF